MICTIKCAWLIKPLEWLMKVLSYTICPIVILTVLGILIKLTYDNSGKIIGAIYQISIAEGITAIGSLTAAIVAYYALKQAREINKRSAFDQRFTHLLESAKTYISDPRLSHVSKFYNLKQSGATNTTSSMSLDAVLRSFISGNIAQNMQPQVKQHDIYDNFSAKTFNIPTFLLVSIGIKESIHTNGGLSARGLFAYWSNFCGRLVYIADFQKCFKALYSVVMLVEDAQLSTKVKEQYITIIKNNLSKDVLLCYMLSLYVYNDGSDRDYVSRLRGYNFFEDLFGDEYFRGLIRRGLPHDMFSLFTRQQ